MRVQCQLVGGLEAVQELVDYELLLALGLELLVSEKLF